jgi:hypothetical protein
MYHTIPGHHQALVVEEELWFEEMDKPQHTMIGMAIVQQHMRKESVKTNSGDGLRRTRKNTSQSSTRH